MGEEGLASKRRQNVVLFRPQLLSVVLGQGAGYATGISVQAPDLQINSTGKTGAIYLVGEEGLEPSIREERDFESRAYTNSATRPSFAFKDYCS